MTVESIKNIAVIGAGTMGQGIAQLCALAGYPVLLYDIQPELTRTAIASTRRIFEDLVARGKITAAQRDASINRIEAVHDFRQLQVDLAIEVVLEKLEIKQKILTELEKINAMDCLLVSNTSSLSITQLAAPLKHKERCAGLHFFNPASVMKLIEIVKGAATSEHTVKTLTLFAQSLGKTVAFANDSPGFIVNRINRLFFAESLKVVEENVADFKVVDNLMKASGFRMGPFELIDLVGIDTSYAVSWSLYEAFYYEPKFRPSRIQQQKVDAGLFGRKSGKGFYDYPEDGSGNQ
ncbi:3-hydroxyacyl-CoA dehydrogenase NAD-binding domain-containing protein [Chryseolinea sp. T2]|uniref:3-hydroxyacyl-CoA dehydrogenase NAD-binding domain-containing protein n=1 Tax=Chryseolinea sp. T2 TaxID=3129255 RepID=UPI00307799E0